MITVILLLAAVLPAAITRGSLFERLRCRSINSGRISERWLLEHERTCDKQGREA